MTARRKHRSIKRGVAYAVLTCAIAEWGTRAIGGTQLPVPCLGAACGSSVPGFVTSGAASAVQSGKNLTVLQTSKNATLNWASFNVSADAKVSFQQPTSTSIALNRIYDANPSSIFGSLSANGQIYLINANGFLFGSTARVNVAGLLASSLNLSDSTFASGILAPVQSALPTLEPFKDASGNAIVNTGQITVQTGAQLTATSGGRLLLAAPTVQNAGSLSSPDGQIVLAAGQSIFLQASSDPALRGLIVEVDGQAGNKVVNQLSGQLSASRGNITLAGLAVNQDGRISATTTVAANGSVTLTAASDVNFNGGGVISAKQGGQLELGAGSQINIEPEYSDTTTAVAAQTQLRSAVTLTGEQVFMNGGSIDAPNGILNVLAAANPSLGVSGASDPDARIRIESGTQIDLSGSSAELPMAANLVTVQLRSNELADDPTQRDGALRGQTVTVDVRADGGAGTPIADVSSAIAAVGLNIAQRTETGGTASFLSTGDVVFNPGAAINVSGGATTYLGGNIQTTALVGANGQLYDIGTANPLQTYRGAVNPNFVQSFDKWGVREVVASPGLTHYQSTYQQGAAAGSIQFAAPSLVLDGSLKGSATSGPYQRGPYGTAFVDAVPGGTLTIGVNATATPLNPVDLLAPSIVIATNPTPIVVANDAALPAQTLQLPAAWLTSDGFTTVALNSNESILLPRGLPLQLAQGTTLSMQASRLDIDSNVIDLGGAINAQSVLTVADQNPQSIPSLGSGIPRLGIGIGDGVALDVSGRWTNEGLLVGGPGSGPTWQDGGSILLRLTLPGSELVLGNDVALKADGGAWAQSSGSVTNGKGGSITLDASPAPSALQFGQGTTVEAFGTGSARGGTFSLTAPRIQVSDGTGASWTKSQRVDDVDAPGAVLDLYAPLFTADGFSSVNLAATGAIVSTKTNDLLTILSGTTIDAKSRSRQLTPGYQNRASGGTISAFSQVALLPDYLRPAINLTFSVARQADDFILGKAAIGDLDLQAGAAISADAGSSITLTGQGSVLVGGALRAPGGTVTLETVPAPSDFDLGYIAGQGIDLGTRALIDVSGGSALMSPSNQNLLLGTVRSGGSVDIVAQRGTVLAEAGSTINLAGTSATLDVLDPHSNTGYSREVVATAGGSLTLSSVESINFLSSVNAAAGKGTSGLAAAGSLEVDLVRNNVIEGQPASDQPLQIELTGTTAGAPSTVADIGEAVLGITQIAKSGFDSLTLNAGGATAGNILIDTNQPLALARQVIFNSRTLSVADGKTGNISAPYVQIGNSAFQGPVSTVPSLPTAGTGKLLVQATQQLDLLGNFSLQGIASAVLSSQGDVQLQGTTALSASGGVETGFLATSGNLSINAARVYPDTFTNFTIQSTAGLGGKVTIGQTAASSGTPLSAGGVVSISADNIEVDGSLLAPFGSINLTAADSLILGNHSLVSISGAGVDVPYGQTLGNGAQWIYQTPFTGISTVAGVPAKQVTLTSPSITLDPSATVNLQGGGDLYSFEFVPGTGGHTDALAGTGAFSGLYAILSGARGQSAPYDPQNSGIASSTQTVYLTGGAGLAAGFYALLPARYALQPGAYLIQFEPGYVSASGGKIGALTDGTPVLAGYLSSGTTGLHAGATEFQGFAVYPGSYSQKLATYDINSASTYFSTVATLAGTGRVAEPADAGSLTLAIVQALNNSLTLEGSVLPSAASGGRGASINISAPNLEVTAGNQTGAAGAIAVSGSVLQGWNASSIILGGSLAADGTSAVVAANDVKVDSGVKLTADQVLLLAQQSIDVESGAVLSATSANSGKALTDLPTSQSLVLTDASGVALPQAGLLAVSDLELPLVSRTGYGAGGATITLKPGSVLASGGALALDAPGAVVLDGSLSGKGASWSLSSGSVAFVGAGGSADSLNIGTSLLADLQQAGAVRIASTGAIDLLTPVTLGAAAVNSVPTLSSLTLSGASLNNQNAGGSVFGAGSLTLENAGSPSSSAPIVGSGGLSLVANSLDIGPGTLALSGFDHEVLQVRGAVMSSGVGGLNAAGDLAINAVEISPGSGSQTAIAASGALTIGAPTVLTAGTKLPTALGGALALSGASIEDEGVIAAPSGLVGLTASSGNLHLTGTASISAAGTIVNAVDESASSPGGSVALSSAGDLTLDAGSKINVAGNGLAPAGTLAVFAAGAANIASDARLVGSAGVGGVGGSISLDAGVLTNGLTSLASSLGTGGFTDAVSVRVRGGDLDLAAATAGKGAITANQISLTADAGAVDIAGVLNAPSAAQRGWIDLSGGTSVTLESTGQLHADGAGTTGRGGEIDLNSTCAACAITLETGSVISAKGSTQMGELVLRAPALGSDDVAINVGQGIGANVSQIGQIIVEPVRVFQTTAGTVNADLGNAVQNWASPYLTAATPVISARLAASGTPVSVRAGVELQDNVVTDTLALQSYDFSSLSAPGPGLTGQVINLAVRAAGSIEIDGTISDGFIDDPNVGIIALSNAPSASFSFVAGADLTSANPLSVLRGSAASLTLASSNTPADGTIDGAGPAVVRTGTGNIDLAAAGSVIFASGTSNSYRPSVYTGGMAVPNVQPADLNIDGSDVLINFGTGGGNVRVGAGLDVVGAPVNGDAGNYSVVGWQLRQGSQNNAAQYGVNYLAFDWNIGALAGGDVTVRAGRDASNVSAAVADSLVAANPENNTVSAVYGAGGGLALVAGGDIGSAQLYVASGVGTVTAGGGLTAVRPTNNVGVFAGSSFALGDSQLSVWARQGVQVDAIYNPSVLPQLQQSTDVLGQFYTYGPSSAVNLSSTAGTVNLEVDTQTMNTLLGAPLVAAAQSALSVMPASLSMQALQGDIDLTTAGIGGEYLFPSSTGQLTLFAARDIVSSFQSGLTMSDSFLSSIPTVSAPGITLSRASNAQGGLVAFQGDVHAGDATVALVTAGRDIQGLGLSVPKAARVVAGRDLIDLVYNGQHSSASDTTLIAAGRDLNDDLTGAAIRVGGEGSLEVLAGRNLNLGASNGVVTLGNLANANLPTSQGADLTLMTGYGSQGADLSGFLQKIIASPAGTAYQTQLVDEVDALTGSAGLTFAQAKSKFLDLPVSEQTAFVDDVFFNELLLSGRAANSGSGVGFEQGYAAIDALFPNSRSSANPYSGDLTLTFSQIATLSGGNIAVLVPGGQINVGLANPPVNNLNRSASQLGILAEGPGNVNIYSTGDVNVNKSRIFTLGGGNILIWSDKGSIDAGNGSKSSLSIPPPVVLISADGTISLDYGGSLAAGSGIRTIQTSPTVPPGNVDLDAPVGTVNAGDAGIGASGNINIAAAHVIGLDNIQFGGTSAGVPADVSNLGASLSGVSAIASNATSSASAAAAEANAAKEVTPLAQTALSWLDVFVTGLGEENCKPDDIECLKRQKTAAP